METLVKLFEQSVEKFPDNVLMYEKREGSYQGVSYAQMRAQVLRFGAGLMALGVNKGDRIAIIAEGRTDWLVAELGIFYAGAVNVPLSIKLDASADLLFRVTHSGAKYIMVSWTQEDKVDQFFEQATCLEKVICFDQPQTEKPYKISFEQIKLMGDEFLKDEANRSRFEQSWKKVQPNDLANISYTSGTTAQPKGIMLTQNNYASNVIQANSLMSITPEFKTLTILPWDHSFAHTACLYCFMYNGASIAAQEIGKTAIETLKNIPKNINEIKPDIMMSVPALSKAFKKNIQGNIKSKGKITTALFNLALNVAYAYNGLGYNRGRGARILLRPLNRLFDKILFSKVRAAFGGNLKFFIGGGALLDTDLQRFFAAIGIPVMQGYGLTEASPIISSNALHAHKFGSSGKVVKHMAIKICDEDGNELHKGQKGEIVIQGGNVMKGYWMNPEATAETIKKGWLYTGDLGYIDADNYLFVLGRFKSLLIGNDGEKYSPEGIEEAMVELSPYIDQCMLYNNQSAYTSGFIVPNIPALKQALASKGYGKLTEKKAIDEALRMIQQEVDSFKQGGKNGGMFPDRWLPASLAILPESFNEQNQLLNSTLKIVRGKIVEHFTHELKHLYTPASKNICNDMNRKSLGIWFSK